MENILKYNYILNKTNLTFFEVLERKTKFPYLNPFVNYGCEKFCEEIIAPNLNLNFILKKEDFEIIRFVIIDERNFNGKIDFLEELINLEYLYISGINGVGKTSNLTPLKNLKKIKYIDIHNCSIDDLTPISGLTEIEYLLLSDNPVKTIKPISHFKKLRKIKLFFQADYRKEERLTYNDSEFEELKKNSINCEIEFTAFNSESNEYYTKVL